MWTVLVITPDDKHLRAWDCADRGQAVRRYDAVVRQELADGTDNAIVMWDPDGTEVDR